MIKRNFHVLMIVIVIIIIICGYILSNINYNRLLKYTKYTSALITSDWHHKNSTGVGVDYEYYVNGKKYEYTINLDLKKNEKYLLAYDSLKPNNCRILEIYPLNTDLVSSSDGWRFDEIPIKVNHQKIIQYLKMNK